MEKVKRINDSYAKVRFENLFRRSLVAIAVLVVILVLGVFLTLVIGSLPSLKVLGAKYLWGRTWDPVNNIYGAFPFLLGTLLTSFLALVISIPFSFAIALYLGEYNIKGWLGGFLKNVVEVIAAVPSVIYGFWALVTIVPIVRALEVKLGVAPYGVGVFTSSIVLAIMIVPYAASLGRELILLVPSSLKEGAYALGATRYEVVKNVVLPYTKSGMAAGVLLSLGRALGETMAVTMVIGNTSIIPTSIFSPGNTMASVIANEFTEAAHTVYLSALIELALVLFLVTVVINMLGKRIIKRFAND
ncbi:MAG TPA: phosphate ABC transporter permease subunit PstC [Chitinophagaceae bacterium]|nr:phosphate ABC transporter permease subunit PstC [Chitinophagaceae bacterium]